MGKLEVTVHSLELYPPAFGWREDAVVSPRVHITVDDTYQFHTKTKRKNTSVSYEEKFTVGNTHRLAIIEVLVYSVSESSGFSLLREEKNLEERLVARTFVAIGRLVQGQTKTRNYYLATIPRDMENNLFAPPPDGIAGTITLSLYSEALGEPNTALRLDANVERQYVERIKRLFLKCSPEDVAMIDPVISHCRDVKEIVRDFSGSRRNSSIAAKRTSTTSGAPKPLLSPSATSTTLARATGNAGLELITLGMRTVLPASESNLTLRPLEFHRPPTSESFEEVIRRLCRQYRTTEPAAGRLHVRLLGLTNLDKTALNTSLLGSDSVVTVLRTPAEVFVANSATLKETVVYDEDTVVEFDVMNPAHFFVHVLVLGKNGSTYYEIGRCNVSVSALATGHLSPRHIFLTRGDALYTALAFPAVIHLILEPLNFGLTPLEKVASVDAFYDRLSRFFRRYDPVRVPSVDQLVCARRANLEDLMNDLVVEHGREPGTVRLELTVRSVTSLRESATVEMHRREVMAIVTMGHSTITSDTRTVRRFAACNFDECYTFDVVRETDMLRIEIVRASNPDEVYGRVEFTCLNTQRGVANTRRLWLVGDAGTPEAYFSGIVTVSMMSQEIGHPYEVDVAYENMMAGRLRRYAFRRIPETVHRVNLAVATVFDMETFMAQLAARYGDEDPTYVIYFTITGCRRLRQRFGGINPYVVARVGVATYETKWVKSNNEPDFFEFCEFYYDRPGDNAITLIVMDHSDIGEDREIGHAIIPLGNTQVGTQYNDFVSLVSSDPKDRKKDIGAVGFKYTVFDTNLVDHTRTCLMRSEARRLSKGQIGGLWVEGVRSVPSLHAEEAREARGLSTQSRSASSDDVSSRASTTTAGVTASSREPAESSRWSRWMGGAWHSLRAGFRSGEHGVDTFNRGAASAASPSRGHRARRSRTRKEAPLRRSSLPSGAVSPEVLSRLPSAASVSSFNSDTSAVSRTDRRTARVLRRPTQNLMDGGIVCVDEFCSEMPGDSRMPSAQPSTDFLADFGTESAGLHTRTNSNSSARFGSGVSTPASNGGGGGSAAGGGGGEGRAGLTPQCALSKSRRSGPSPSVHFADTCRATDAICHVRVRILFCRNLANHSSQLPNPYLLLSTNHESRRTHVEFATLQPQFQCEYLMRVDDPYHDSLGITVLSDTPFGSRKLGHCVLSLANVQRGEFRTRWASLVVHSHETSAEESGSICVSLRGEGFGLELVPAADAENRLRERIRSYLVSEHPEQLHLLEWFVGEYTRKEGFVLRSALQRPSRFLWGGLRNTAPTTSKDLGSNVKQQLDKAFGGASHAGVKGTKEKEAAIQVTIHDIAHLYVDDFLATGSCQVKVSLEERSGKSSKRTRSADGKEGFFSLEEQLTMVLKHPSAATNMRFAVTFDGSQHVGLCFASLSDLHRGVPQRRRYMLVMGANTAAPLITGYLTATILSSEYGSGEAAPTEDEEERFERLQAFFAYYLPREVATTALTYAATFNVDAYLRKLVEQHGPEPGEHALRVTIDRCTDVHVSTARFGEGGATATAAAGGGGGRATSAGSKANAGLTPFCIVRCGLQEFHSGVVTGGTEFVFLESFDLNIGLPERDLLEFILMSHIPSQGRSEEIGRAVVPLDKQVCDETNVMHLPIVHNPGTQHAEIKGTVVIGLFTTDFGDNPDLGGAARTQSVFAITTTPGVTRAPAFSSTQTGKRDPPPTGFHPRTASHSATHGGPPLRRQTTTGPSLHAHRANASGTEVASAAGTGSPTQPPPYVMFDAAHAMLHGSPDRSIATSPIPSAPLHSHTGTGVSLGAAGDTTTSFASVTPSRTSRAAAASSDNPPVKMAILGIVFANSEVKPTRDVHLRVSMGGNVLFRTKPMSADALSTLAHGEFELADTSEVSYAMLTLKMSLNQVVGKAALCYADLTLARCAPCTTEIRRLRLYHTETHQFLGVCRFQITMPDIKIVNAERPIKPKAVEPLLDDLASLFATYSRKDLRRLTYALYRSTDNEGIHNTMRQQLAPSVVATFYLAVHKVELEGTLKNNCVVEASVGAYSVFSARRQTAVKGILEYGMSNPEVQKLEFPLARVDVSVTGEGTSDTVTMCLRVFDVNKADKAQRRSPVGSVVVSLRALLSPQLYDMSEPVTVSLVSVDRSANRAHASLAGSITFSLLPPAYETYPRAVRFASSSVQTVSRTYVRYYLARLDRFLRHYDPNSLEQLHALVYDKYIENGKWESELPQMLTGLINRWGPEKGPVTQPPELQPRGERITKAVSRASNLSRHKADGELAPAFAANA